MSFDKISLDIEFGGQETAPLKKGPLCFKGSSGGSDGSNYDAAYNARLASIQERQQGIADDIYSFYKTGGARDLESEQIEANRELVPLQTSLEKSNIEAQQTLLPSTTALGVASNEAALKLLPGQTSLAQAKIADTMAAMGERAPVRAEFYKQALTGVDANARATKAGADAAHAFKNSLDVAKMDAARMGVNPGSERFMADSTSNALNRSKMIAGAKTRARTQAEQENFGRLTSAMGYGG